jgi:hypothetical protein
MRIMYRAHTLLSTPPDDAELWRYLDLSHFLWLLSQQALYFANVKEFSDDAWEGAFPAGTEEALRRMYWEGMGGDPAPAGANIPKEQTEPAMIQIFKRALISQQATYGVNCWHKNKVESVAMWKLYTQGKDGVAIQTTVGHLKACLLHEPRLIYIANVKYGHDAQDPISDDPLIPIITKRRSFEHESEVRLILERRNQKAFAPLTGETVAVDVRNLINRIVASPNYPGWAMASLQERVTAAGLEVVVEKSDLLKLPEMPLPIWLRS